MQLRDVLTFAIVYILSYDGNTNNINNLSNSDFNRVVSGQKHTINMDNWKNSKNKNLRNSGKEYTSRSNYV